MIDIKTVIVLGAGASLHAGYKVGAAFNSRICELRSDRSFLEMAKSLHLSEVQEFLDRFASSAMKSPDRFLEEYPQYKVAGKLCIAKILTRHEHDDELFRDAHAGWYESLFNELDIDSTKNDIDNLSIVTFNYDRSLEHCIWKILEARYDDVYERDQYWRIRPKIVHVHGCLSNSDPLDSLHRPYKVPEKASELQAAANHIQIVSEADPNTPEFLKARDLLEASDRIVFLGFGFDPRNLSRLMVFSSDANCQKVVGTLRGPGARERLQILDRAFEGKIRNDALTNAPIDRFMSENF